MVFLDQKSFDSRFSPLHCGDEISIFHFCMEQKKYDRSAQKPSIKRPTNKRDLSYMNIEQIICESRNIRKVNKMFGFPSGAHIMGFFSECVRKRSKPSYRLSYAFFLIWFPVCAPHDEGFEVDNSRSHPKAQWKPM